MCAAASRQVSLALFLCAMAVGLSPSQTQAEESGLYKLGKYTAYASHCGHRDLVTELQSRYGGSQDFKTGRQKNDLQRYDSVRLACGRLKRNLEEFVEKQRAKEAR